MTKPALDPAAPLVFITGASSGIGQAIAAVYAAQGARLALVARRLPEMQAWIEAQHLPAQQARAYAADVADVHSIGQAARDCMAAQGLPDVVIANAGISVGMDTQELGDLEVMRQTFAINNVGMAATFQPFLQAMRQRRRGMLVGVASVAGIRGLPGHGAYCASKAGVISYCESLRIETASSGVKVLTLVPGYIDTPLTRGNRYSMPFLMPAQRFAQSAVKAIAQGDSYRVIPWQMAWVARLMRLLPNVWFDKAAQGRGRKRRQGE